MLGLKKEYSPGSHKAKFARSSVSVKSTGLGGGCMTLTELSSWSSIIVSGLSSTQSIGSSGKSSAKLQDHANYDKYNDTKLGRDPEIHCTEILDRHN